MACIRTRCEDAADAERAAHMSAYVRDQFAYFGIQTKPRDQIMAACIADHGPIDGELARQIARLAWDEPEREWQNIGVRLLRQRIKQLPADAIDDLAWCITHKSWWDTVDELATRVTGPLVTAYPELVGIMDDWIDDDNMWLNRAAILHQLNYFEATDVDRLFAYCRRHASSDEFFLRKAIGWALRQYTRTDPAAVRAFVDAEHDSLSGLSIREATRHLGPPA